MRKLLAAGLIALMPLGLAAAPAQAATTRPTTAHPAAVAAAKAKPKLGPSGFGKVKLGMTARQVRKTHQAVLKNALHGSSCSGWDLKAYRTPKNSVGLYLSRKQGVAVIFAQKGIKTPRGIGLGSTAAQVRKAYPKYQKVEYGYFITVPRNKKAIYMVGFRKGKVVELSLALRAQDCVQ